MLSTEPGAGHTGGTSMTVKRFLRRASRNKAVGSNTGWRIDRLVVENGGKDKLTPGGLRALSPIPRYARLSCAANGETYEQHGTTRLLGEGLSDQGRK